ncbi:hypothetical protein [Bacillus sp. SA1-12]|uniref:hypothetical protein n=1 Tax=Bacillus sp. SA1-12 TaxID=1455638 RepID=UPI001E3AE2E7|nr:hypothetical protein [Bacillus sp. SA1-12]
MLYIALPIYWKEVGLAGKLKFYYPLIDSYDYRLIHSLAGFIREFHRRDNNNLYIK